MVFYVSESVSFNEKVDWTDFGRVGLNAAIETCEVGRVQ